MIFHNKPHQSLLISDIIQLTLASAPNVRRLFHEPNEIFDSIEDWESEANHGSFSLVGNANTEHEKTVYDVIDEYQNQIIEKMAQSSNLPRYLKLQALRNHEFKKCKNLFLRTPQPLQS